MPILGTRAGQTPCINKRGAQKGRPFGGKGVREAAYSAANASTGLSLDARQAGKTPDRAPRLNEDTRTPLMSQPSMMGVNDPTPKLGPSKRDPSKLSVLPRINPRTPPMSPINPESTKNRIITCPSRAPTDLRIPISRVLSSTAVYIVFISPTPPTMRVTAAMLASTVSMRLSVPWISSAIS